MKKAWFLVLLPLLFMGCITLPPPPPGHYGNLDVTPRDVQPANDETAKQYLPVDGFAVVYIYREWMFRGGGRNWSVLINGTTVCVLPNGSYTRVVLPEGDYDVRIGDRSSFIDRDINVKTGQVYFFGHTDSYRYTYPPRYLFVAAEDAKEIIADLKLIENPYNRRP